MQSIEQKLEMPDHPTGVLSICGKCSQEALERAYMGNKPRPVRLGHGGAGFTHWSKKYLDHDCSAADLDGAILYHLRVYYVCVDRNVGRSLPDPVLYRLKRSEES